MLHIWRTILWWLEIHTGTTNEPGPYYGFWSGFGSDLGELTIVVAVLAGIRHVNCAVKRCPRIGHHQVKGTHYKTCHKHTTKAWHEALQIDHSEQFPDQHEFMNSDTIEANKEN